jgi:two-component system, NarL family, response regulator NreC
MALRVLLADDHDVVRQAFRTLLEHEGFQIAAEAADGRAAVQLAALHQPDLALLDLSMPVLNGIEAGHQIVQLPGTRTKVVLLTMHTDEHQIVAALRAGIRGYVVKTQGTKDLIQALRHVASGGVYLSPSACGGVVDHYLNGIETPPEPLSSREREVLQLVAEGQTTKQIASTLTVSVKTAESHRGRIMNKLDIHDTAGLVRYAIRRGLIEAAVMLCFAGRLLDALV